MNGFAPYVAEENYKCSLSKDEVLLIQTIRDIGYGTVTAHVVAGKIVRTEMTKSELSKDKKKESITIAFEVTGK